MSYQQPGNYGSGHYGSQQYGSGEHGYQQSANPYVQQPTNPYEQPAQQPYPPMAVYSPYAMQPEHPNATTVLILGILALVLGGVTGPFAWVMGHKARRQIRENPGMYRDGGMLTVGWVLGIVGTCYLAFLALFFVVYFIFVIGMIMSLGY